MNEVLFRRFLPILLLAFLTLIAFCIRPGWFAWAKLSLPVRARRAGIAVGLSGFMLLDWSQVPFGLLEYFGEQYREYMKNSGRLFPRAI